MHIVHLSTPISWRGGEQQIAYLATELAQKGIKQTIICPKNSELYKFCKKSDIEVSTLKGKLQFSQAKFLAKWCKVNKPSLIHLHDSQAHTVGILSSIFFGNKVNFILSRRVIFPIKTNFLTSYKYNCQQIKKIVCVSEGIKEVASKVIQDITKLVVVYSGIDLNKFTVIERNQTYLKEEFNIPDDAILIGNVAALTSEKDYMTFLKTARLLIKKKREYYFHFLLIGKEGNDVENIKSYIEDHQLQKYITLTGFRSDIPQVLPQLDIFLFTSKTEGLGTSVLDAFASGVPVVATAAGGVPESVIHQKTGLLANVGDAETLAKYVQQILSDKKLKTELVTNAKKHLQQFTKEKMAEKTLAIYREVFNMPTK